MKRPTSERRKHTPFSTLIGWSGWAAALSGVLFAAWGYLDREEHFWYLDVPVNVLGVVVPLLFFVGLAGVYLKCKRQMGWLGESGFVFSLAGIGRGIYVGVMNAYGWYVYTAKRDDYWEEGYTASEEAIIAEKGWLLMGLSGWLPLLLVGLTIAGVATVRRRGLRHWGFLLLTMALFGWLYQFTDVGTIMEARSVHVVFGVLFSLSWVVLGYALWSSRNTVGRATTRSLQRPS